MKATATLIIGLILSITLTSCQKEQSIQQGEVGIYLIENHEVKPGSVSINADQVQLADQALFTYQDLEKYHIGVCSFQVSESSRERFNNSIDSLYFKAFAVVADNDIVYTGYFWPMFSSQSCNWVVISPTQLQLGNQMRVSVGYPGAMDNQPIPDNRNDQRILNIFERDGKLVK